jgi:GST-like protein
MKKAKAAVSGRKSKGTAAKPVLRGKANAKASRPRPSRPIALFYWPTPNGRKVTIALEELNVPYDVRLVDIGKGEQFAPDFLKISPNNRMPAIIDPDGPGGRPVSVFESGAILQYLGRKYGRLYPAEERARIQVEEWLFWQVGGLGPMAGQANHFNLYAPEAIPYAKKRYTDEVHRLFGVMDKRLAARKFLAGAYSIADIASWPWAVSAKRHVSFDDFPNLAAWVERVGARPAVKRGFAVNQEQRKPITDAERQHLFGQRARA